MFKKKAHHFSGATGGGATTGGGGSGGGAGVTAGKGEKEKESMPPPPAPQRRPPTFLEPPGEELIDLANLSPNEPPSFFLTEPGVAPPPWREFAKLMRRLGNAHKTHEFGCAAQESCNDASHNHAAESDISPLMRAWHGSKKKQAAKKTKRGNVAPAVLADPFFSNQFPLNRFVFKMTNEKSTHRGDPHGEALQSKTFHGAVLRLRQFFHQQWADTVAARNEKHELVEAAYKQRCEEIDANLPRNTSESLHARGEIDAARVAEIQHIEVGHNLRLECQHACLDSAAHTIIAAYGQVDFPLPYLVVHKAVVEICRLPGGHERDNSFYMHLAVEVTKGNLGPLTLEKNFRLLQRNQQAAATTTPVQPTLQHEQFIRSASYVTQADVLTRQEERIQAEENRKPQTFDDEIVDDDDVESMQREAESAAEDRTKEKEDQIVDDYDVEAMQREAEAAAAAAEEKNKEKGEEEEKIEDDDNGDEMLQLLHNLTGAQQKTPVLTTPCVSQFRILSGKTACTPIAFFAAFTMINRQHSVNWHRCLEQGAAIWRQWYAKQSDQSITFMMGKEVLSEWPNAREQMANANVEVIEFGGVLYGNSAIGTNESGDTADSSTPTLEAAFKQLEQLGSKTLFSGVITFRSTSIAFCCDAAKGKYRLFDSHGNVDHPTRSLLYAATSLEQLLGVIRAKFVPSRANLEQNSYSLLAFYVK